MWHRRTVCRSLAGAGLAWSLPGLSLAQGTAGPATFQLGVLPNISARQILAQYQPMREDLAQALGRPVDVVTATNFKAFALATAERRYQLIVTAPNLGRVAQLDHGWHPLGVYEPGIPALLVASAQQRDDAVGQLRGKALALANPQSLVALVGLKWLADQGLRAGTDFRVVQTANDDSLGTLLLSGEAPLAMMSMGEFRAKSEAMQKSLRIVTEMARLPGFLVMASPDLPAAERQRLQTWLLGFPAQPAGQRFLGLTGFTGIRPVQAQDLKFLDDHVEVTRRSLAGT